MSDFKVVPTQQWQEDVQAHKDFLLERELASATIDETILERFDDVLTQALGILTFAPHTCRRLETRPGMRELLVPFGRLSGCVVLIAIEGEEVVLVAARPEVARDYR